ncbi:alpha/beta hydrolase [Hahella sp. CCB-MM4]|uniref:alpha/beta fold hydrolase n=1 Tax=Hahella sp. (strain CCB-MM4) TaxID=1926491 RepID=UPI000B9B45CE|nr:alpha/beta hydrolase [Hahella sp. CCB-MM4]OZG73252.1 alpha/beta hydrolase [Hahella sp. CCB-MM4]
MAVIRSTERSIDGAGLNRYLEIDAERLLSYREWGDTKGYPVFYAHGTPGSSMEGAMFHDFAKHYHLRWIVMDRPGIGDSSMVPHYSLLDYPRDVSRLAQELCISQFAVVGWSSGVPHTLACAYTFPEKLSYVGALAGYTNFAEMANAKDLLWSLEQRGPRIADVSPLLFRSLMNMIRLAEQHLPKIYLKFVESSSTQEDKALLRQPDVLDRFLASQDTAFSQGTNGVVQDLLLQYKDWGFCLKDVRMPVHVYQGLEDRFVPWQFGAHLAEQMPLVDLQLLEQEGHMFPLRHSFQQRFMESLMSAVKGLTSPEHGSEQD